MYYRQILSGLVFCHSRGVSHGDIKPHSILIDGHNRCKLADFGLSQHLNSSVTSRQFLGSRAFMAPEVMEKRPHDPFLADVWSLGVTFYWMAVGESPFPDESLLLDAAWCGLPLPSSRMVGAQVRAMLRAMGQADPAKRMSTTALGERPFFQGRDDTASRIFFRESEGSNSLRNLRMIASSASMATLPSKGKLRGSSTVSGAFPMIIRPALTGVTWAPRDEDQPNSESEFV
jgi:serine/threonine protein kinase